MIQIICVGKLKEKYLKDAVDDYTKRINKYHKIQIVEMNEEKTIEIEGEKILQKVKDDYVIVLDIGGEMPDSVNFSHIIEKTFIFNSKITFIIGSSLGLSKDVKNRANKLISFSKMTFPHGLFRIILLEQIYRSFKIINNEQYHK